MRAWAVCVNGSNMLLNEGYRLVWKHSGEWLFEVFLTGWVTTVAIFGWFSVLWNQTVNCCSASANEILTNRSPWQWQWCHVLSRCVLLFWPRPLLSSCHGDVTLARSALWPLGDAVCDLLLSSNESMVSVNKWSVGWVYSFFFFILQPMF